MASAATVLRDICEQQLTLFLYDSALFVAERLYYQEATESNLNLVGQCMYRMGQFQQVYILLQNSKEASNRYLFALACLQLAKYSEAESALLPAASKPINLTNVSDEIVAKVMHWSLLDLRPCLRC